MDTEDSQKLERMKHFVRAAIPNVYLSNDIRDYERFDPAKSARNASFLKMVSSFAAGSVFEDPNEKAKDLNEAQMVDIVMKAAPTIALVATRTSKRTRIVLRLPVILARRTTGLVRSSRRRSREKTMELI